MSETVDPVELSNRIIDTGNPEPPHNRELDELVELEAEVAEVLQIPALLYRQTE